MAFMALLADDATGTFDAAIPFVEDRVNVVVNPDMRCIGKVARKSEGVIAINASTRHMNAYNAYLRVRMLLEELADTDTGVFFKKTDSVMRGNIGAELSAVWSVLGERTVHFVPAWPSMGRTTRGGIHYVNGIPVAESDFGRDSFTPVTSSNVVEIVQSQSDAPVFYVREGEPAPDGFSGIVVYEASSERAMLERSAELYRIWKSEGRIAVAGCAGLAHAFRAQYASDPDRREIEYEGGGLLVVCGSINPVSVGQCRAATAAGAEALYITREMKFDDAWPDTALAASMYDRIADSWGRSDLTIVDATDFDKSDLSLRKDIRSVVAKNLGRSLAEVVSRRGFGNVLAVGGDVFLALVKALAVTDISLLGEIVPGVIVSEAELPTGRLVMVSKSGGFGEPGLFCDVAATIKGRRAFTEA